MTERTEPADGQEPEQPSVDYSQESLEQLEARLLAGEGIAEEPDPEPEPEPTPEDEPAPPEQEAAESEMTEVAEDEQPQEQEPAPEQQAEPTEESAPEEAFDERQSQIDELRLMLEKSEADRKKAELLQSRDAGLAGHLKQEMERLRQALEQQPAADAYDEAEAPQARPQPRPAPTGDTVLQSRLAELETEARAGAISAEYGAFLRDKGIDGDATQVMERMAPSIQEQWKPYQEEMQNMSASSLRKVVRVVLDSAYADMRLQEVREAREEALKRKASQVSERKKAIKQAAVAGSGASPAPKSKPKPVEELSAEEADAELIKQYGDGHSRRRR